jgi:hypothetical protein
VTAIVYFDGPAPDCSSLHCKGAIVYMLASRTKGLMQQQRECASCGRKVNIMTLLAYSIQVVLYAGTARYAMSALR